ncbi:TetR/AcrR family transcriptional regulator [uncultured Hyphomonas sp.]|uniref:TetR/AcrR family transcriptional regulator n=1 Tax=uncultured Hyphomonas sp. TaxID=225298 RepID=UPI002AAC3325|nr:TetR/AcrR family transcriptional regulator [uncultured Hyphomonas sp.]
MVEINRRNPKQARAKATVDAILEAAFQVLDADGYANFTTSRIAKRAGVSIGTLYQYFDDRDAILMEMGQRYGNALREKITQMLLDEPEISTLRTIIRAVMQGVEGSPETQLVLSDTIFRTGGGSEVSRQHFTFMDSLSQREEFQFALGKEASFILTHTVVYLLRATVVEPDLDLDPQVLEDELVHLMESYIANLAGRAQA